MRPALPVSDRWSAYASVRLPEPEVWWKTDPSQVESWMSGGVLKRKIEATPPSWQTLLQADVLRSSSDPQAAAGGGLGLASHPWAETCSRGRRGTMPHQASQCISKQVSSGASPYDFNVYGALRRKHRGDLPIEVPSQEEPSEAAVAAWVRLVEAYRSHCHREAVKEAAHPLVVHPDAIAIGGQLQQNLESRLGIPCLPAQAMEPVIAMDVESDLPASPPPGSEDFESASQSETSEEDEAEVGDLDAARSDVTSHQDSVAQLPTAADVQHGEPEVLEAVSEISLQLPIGAPTSFGPEALHTPAIELDGCSRDTFREDAEQRLSAEQLEEMLYAQLRLLDSVDTQVQAADELIAQQQLERQQRNMVLALQRQHEEAAIFAQAWQESQFAWALQCLEVQHSMQMQELQLGVQTAQQQVEAERHAVEQQLIVEERLRQDEERLERERLEREEAKIKAMRANIAAERLEKEQIEWEELGQRRRQLEEEQRIRSQERIAQDAIRAEVQRERELVLQERHRIAEEAAQRAAEEAERASKMRIEQEERRRLDQAHAEEQRVAQEQRAQQERDQLQSERQEREKAARSLADALKEVKEVSLQVRSALSAPLQHAAAAPTPLADAIRLTDLPASSAHGPPKAAGKAGTSPNDSYDEDFEQNSESYSQSFVATELTHSAAPAEATRRRPSKVSAVSMEGEDSIHFDRAPSDPADSVLEEVGGWSGSEDAASESGSRSGSDRGGPPESIPSVHSAGSIVEESMPGVGRSPQPSSTESLQEHFSRQASRTYGTEQSVSEEQFSRQWSQTHASQSSVSEDVGGGPASSGAQEVSLGSVPDEASEASAPQSIHTGSSGISGTGLARQVVEESFARSSMQEEVISEDPNVAASASGSVPEDEAAAVPSESGASWNASVSKASIPESASEQYSRSGVHHDAQEVGSAVEEVQSRSASAVSAAQSIAEDASIEEPDTAFHRSVSWRSRQDRSASMASIPEFGPASEADAAPSEELSVPDEADEDADDSEPSIPQSSAQQEDLTVESEVPDDMMPSMSVQSQLEIVEGDDSMQRGLSVQSHMEASVVESVAAASEIPSEVSASEPSRLRRSGRLTASIAQATEPSEHYTEDFDDKDDANEHAGDSILEAEDFNHSKSQRTYTGTFEEFDEVEESEEHPEESPRLAAAPSPQPLLQAQGEQTDPESYGSGSFEDDEATLTDHTEARVDEPDPDSGVDEPRMLGSSAENEDESQEDVQDELDFEVAGVEEQQPQRSTAPDAQRTTAPAAPSAPAGAGTPAVSAPPPTAATEAGHVENMELENLRSQVVEKEALLTRLRQEQRRRQEAKEERKLRRRAAMLDHEIAKVQAELEKNDESSSQGSGSSLPFSPPPAMFAPTRRASADSPAPAPSQHTFRGSGPHSDQRELPSFQQPSPRSHPSPSPAHLTGAEAQSRVRSMQSEGPNHSWSIERPPSPIVPASPRSFHGGVFHSHSHLESPRASTIIEPAGTEAQSAADVDPTPARQEILPAAGITRPKKTEGSSSSETSRATPEDRQDFTPVPGSAAATDNEVDFDLSPDSPSTAPVSPGQTPPVVAPSVPPLPRTAEAVAVQQAPVPASWQERNGNDREEAQSTGSGDPEVQVDTITNAILDDLLDELPWGDLARSPDDGKPQSGVGASAVGNEGLGIRKIMRSDRRRLTTEVSLEASPLGMAAEFSDQTPHAAASAHEAIPSPRMRLKLVDVSQPPAVPAGAAEALTEVLVGDLVAELVDRTSRRDANRLRELCHAEAQASQASESVVASFPFDLDFSRTASKVTEAAASSIAVAPISADSSQSVTDNVTESILSGLVDELTKDFSPAELASALEDM